MPHPPEQVWRALAEAPLIEQWLMKNDFEPVVGHAFNFRAPPMPHWNGVVDSEVLVVEPHERLYAWNASGEEAAADSGLSSPWTPDADDEGRFSCASSSRASARGRRQLPGRGLWLAALRRGPRAGRRRAGLIRLSRAQLWEEVDVARAWRYIVEVQEAGKPCRRDRIGSRTISGTPARRSS